MKGDIMVPANLGYTYYNELPGNHGVDFGKKIEDRSCLKPIDLQCDLFKVPGAAEIKFRILYPGLHTGLGYEHPKLSDSNDDFALGFLFDYTTGLPYISGSSIKGVLRSVFPSAEGKSAQDKGKTSFVAEKLKEIGYTGSCGYSAIENIRTALFGDPAGKSNGVGKKKRDIFCDGYICTLPANGQLLASDYITHHPDEVTNPNPVKLLKISPGSVLIVQFVLSSQNEKESGLTSAQRLALYREILLYTGIGAKTNVGRGQFEYVE